MSMGPAKAAESIRKALSMGADKAVHVLDDGLAGSDALATSAVLAAAVGAVGFDLVIAGAESTDGRTGGLPGMVAVRLRPPKPLQGAKGDDYGNSVALALLAAHRGSRVVGGRPHVVLL